MKILFDVTELMPKHVTLDGIYTKYMFRILRSLGLDMDPVFRLPTGSSDNHIDRHIGDTPKKFREFFASKGSILHGPNGSLLSESAKFKKVLTLNELSMFVEGVMPNDTANQMQVHLKEQMQTNPDAIIVPTHTMHNEVVVRFPKMIKKVHVITPGCDHILDNSNISDRRVTESPYFLFVGGLGVRGNISGVIKAFSALLKRNKEVKLVIVGFPDFGSDKVIAAIEKSSLKDRVLIKEGVTPAQLKKFYLDAICLVAPSLYEGFSFPIMEALKVGCPVVTSSLGSIKDVAGDAPHYVKPDSVDQIMGGMERIYVEKSYRKKLVELGRVATADFTWLKCAKEVVSIYNRISG